MSKHELGFMKWLDILTTLLLVIGGLWLGLGGLFGIEVMTSTIASLGVFGRLLYFVIGLSALYEIFGLKAIFRRWHCSLSVSEGTPAGSASS